MQIVVPFNEVVPSEMSMRLPLGVDFGATLAFRSLAGEPVDPTPYNPLLMLMPRSQGGTRSYEVLTYDAANGIGFVAVPADDLLDRSGYNLELYFRDGDPLKPTSLAAQGSVVMQGLAFGTSGPHTGTVTPAPAPAPNTLTGSVGQIADGTAQVVEPEWVKLDITNVSGGVVQEAGGDVEALVSGFGYIEINISVLHNWGSQVIFGFSVNDGPIEELGRVTVNSSAAVPVWARYSREIASGNILKLFISSNFEWAEFAWSGGEVVVAVP